MHKPLSVSTGNNYKSSTKVSNFSVFIWVILSSLLISCSQQATNDYYTAAVVEYQPISNFTLTSIEIILANVAEYAKITASITEDIDIIVFPEATITYRASASTPDQIATEVPKADQNVIPCLESEEEYPEFFRQLSCIARNSNTYLVVNLVEKEKCTAESQAAVGDSRPCASYGYNVYNSNVVFGRNGTVVAKYRKYNLFGEFTSNKTVTPEVVYFETDFNVTFGTFICFDLTFEIPALTLVRDGVKNYVYNAMWISELPFLTALQTQQMWAHANNVNLLASGASNPRSGAGGTGIFQGAYGPLVYDYVAEGGTKVYVANVPKDPENLQSNTKQSTVNFITRDESNPEDMDSFFMLQDFVNDYTSVPLYTSLGEVYEKFCHSSNDSNELCCEFTIQSTLGTINDSMNYYQYRLAAFTGVRTYSGVWNGGIELCGIMACLNETQASCGMRFPDYSQVSWPITFNYIKIQAQFLNVHTRMQYPSSVLSNYRPVYPNATEWITEEYPDQNLVERTLILTEPQNKLLSFAVYGRDFARDSDPFESRSGSEVNRLVAPFVVFVICLLTM